MTRPSRILSAPTLGRALVETAIIVVGVLIALGVDAAWSYRVEREEEQEALQRLNDDFITALAAIEGGLDDYADLTSGLDRLLLVMAEGGVPTGSGILPDSILFGAYRTRYLSVPGGALQSLIASGEIALIRNQALRSDLTGWFDALDRAQNEDTEDRKIYEQILLPTIWPVSSFRNVVGSTDLVPGLRPSTLPSDNARLLRSIEFESALSWRRANATEAMQSYEELRVLARRILEQIRSELRGAAPLHSPESPS